MFWKHQQQFRMFYTVLCKILEYLLYFVNNLVHIAKYILHLVPILTNHYLIPVKPNVNNLPQYHSPRHHISRWPWLYCWTAGSALEYSPLDPHRSICPDSWSAGQTRAERCPRKNHLRTTLQRPQTHWWLSLEEIKVLRVQIGPKFQ